jgi:hypothetical protein
MKTAFFSLLALVAMVSPAIAQDADASRAAGGPVMLSVAQMDTVRAGQLIEIDRTLNNNRVAVAIPVNAAVAANVCVLARGCVSGASAEQRPGNINQP